MSIGLLFGKPIRLYLIISAILSALGYLGVQWVISLGFNPIAIYTLIGILIGALLYLSPITFARRDDSLLTQLPVKTIEKWGFYMFYALILVPGVIEGVWYLLNFIFTCINGELNLNHLMYRCAKLNVDAIKTSDMVFFFGISIIQSGAIIVTVLYIVLFSSSHRIIKGIFGVIGVVFLSGLISAISGFIVAIRNFAELNIEPGSDPILVMEQLRPGFFVVYGLLLIYFIFMTWYIYRRLAKGQVKA